MSDFPVSLFTTVMYLGELRYTEVYCNCLVHQNMSLVRALELKLTELLRTCQACASALCPLVIWTRKPHTWSLAGHGQAHQKARF